MYKNILSIIVIISSIAPSAAMAGRHSIAREEATKIVNNRFAQFYRDEAYRKQAEQQAMEQEILKAKEIEAAMLRELEQNGSDQNRIRTADELEQSMQREFADLNNDTGIHNGTATGVVHNNSSSQDHTFFDLKFGSKENNPFLFLQDLHNASPTKKAAGIKEVIESLQSLPDHQKLSEEFTRDLAKISPEMAQEFSAGFKASLANTKLSQSATSKELSKPSTSDHSDSKDRDNKIKPGTVKIANDQAIKNNIQERSKLQDLKKLQTFNAVTQYSFSPNKLYQIYAAPHKVTVLVLAPGEKIVGSPMCGDPVRWKINTSGNTIGTNSQHLTIQPLRAGITTSITVATNQGRLYLLEATSLKNNYMAVVRWDHSYEG